METEEMSQQSPESRIAVILTTCRRGPDETSRDIEPRQLWNDTIMAMNSVTLYAPEVALVVAWQGPLAPAEFLDNPRLCLVEQPASCGNFGEANAFAVEQTDADELILMNDDAVLTPDTVPLLLEDRDLLRENHPDVRIGLLGCRSNFVAGAQNVRAPNGGTLPPNQLRFDSEGRVIPSDRISPIAAYLERAALEDIGGFPPLHWFSDDLMCFDLKRKGYVNLVSRAYVHHIGQRASVQCGASQQSMSREAIDWLRENRPDFYALLETEQARMTEPSYRRHRAGQS